MDKEARYTAIVKRCEKAIRAMCRVRAKGDSDRCDDLVQDVLLSLWEHIDSLRIGATIRQENAWAMWHTRTVLDHLHRKPVVPTEPISDDIADTVAVEDSSEKDVLQDIMADLDEQDRELVQMFIDGYDGEEIAERMGVSRDAVYKRKQRLLKKLRMLIVVILILVTSVGAVAELADWNHFRLFRFFSRGQSEKTEPKTQPLQPAVSTDTVSPLVSIEHHQDSSTRERSGWAFSLNREDRTVTYVRYANGRKVSAVMHNAPDILFDNENCLISDSMNNTLKQAALTATLAVLATATKAQVACDFQSVSPQGDTLYYNIIDSAAYSVSVFGDEVVSMAPYIHYSDTLVIPSTVEHNGSMYTITSLADKAFRSHDEIKSVVFPPTIRSIGKRALSMTGIFELTVPDAVDTIKANAFKYIANVIYHGSATGSPWGAKTVNGYEEEGIFYSDSTRTRLTASRPGMTSVVVPSTVSVIGDGAFERQSELTGITLPEGLDTIESYAFYHCAALGSLTIPSTVRLIGESAFRDAFKPNGSAVMTIADATLNIDSYAFAYSNIGAIDLGSQTHTIGERAFITCLKLDSVIVPPSVTYIGPGAFCYNYGGRLKKVVLPEGIDTIRFETFHGCEKLLEVNIPSTVVHIDTMAFTECGKIKNWTLPSGLATIGAYAFYDCTGTETITSLAVIPPVVEEDAFSGMNQDRITLTVPCRSAQAYSNNGSWSVFGTIEEDCDGVNVIEQEDYSVFASKGEIHVNLASAMSVSVFDQLGRLIISQKCNGECILRVPEAGVYLVRCGNCSTQKVLVP